MFAIVDIETAGGKPQQGGITEIAVLIHDGTRVTDHFHSLVNPERHIPAFITGLTGIDDAMVADAPRFADIAEELFNRLREYIFVAHNVNFDYSFLRTHFEACGMDFQPAKLCTVRWARQVFIGMKSYSLGRLCEQLDIPITDRHRAMGDAKATAILLERLLNADKEQKWKKLCKLGRRHYLPEHLSDVDFHRLPDATGVYYFKDAKGKVLYVGKAKSIKARVRSHFTGMQAQEKQALHQQIHHIDYELLGNEFIAHLYELVEIKRHFPVFNRAQKYPDPRYGLFPWTDRAGFLRMSMAKVTAGHVPIYSHNSRFGLRTMVHKAAYDLDLCPRLCGIEMNPGLCTPPDKPCPGYCRSTETVEIHNHRMQAFIHAFEEAFDDEVYVHEGRAEEELGFVLLERGRYMGYGFMPRTDFHLEKEHLMAYLRVQKTDTEVSRIIQLFRKHHKGGRWLSLKAEISKVDL